MAPKANVAEVVPDGYVIVWNYWDPAEPVPMLVPIPMPAPIPVVPPAAGAVGIILDYWWEHGFFACGTNHAHDRVNVQWRQFYRQHRT